MVLFKNGKMEQVFIIIVIKKGIKAILKNVTIFVMFLLIIFVKGNEKDPSLIYMLMWTTPQILPFQLTDLEQQYFTKRKCQYQNCFLTNNRTYFSDIRDFDVLLFNVLNIDVSEPPPVRSEEQKYVFMSDEPPAFYPMPLRFDGVFNLTWTYKFDSNATLKYFVVRDHKGEIIGPKKDMHWMNNKDMKPIRKSIKRKLQSKKTAAAWFVSHCDTPIQREQFVQKLKEELDKYKLKVDVFGRCGNLKCPKANKKECNALVETDYYFYLAFENSMCEDYVTEKLLTALKHFAVPVVYGGANYTRFVRYFLFLRLYRFHWLVFN